MSPDPVCGIDTAISVRSLNVSLGNERILKDVSADFPCRKITALIGPNGAGKSTLLSAILGHIPYTGEIHFCSHAAFGRARPQIGYVPQKLWLDPMAPLPVLDFLMLSAQRAPLWLFRSRKARRRALDLLDLMGVAETASKQLGLLSGGELKRVLIANALHSEPDIVLLDEPEAGMDLQGSGLLCEVLERLTLKMERTVLWVTHDLSAVKHHAHHVLLLNKTRLKEGPTDRLLAPSAMESLHGLITTGLEPAHCHDCEAGAPHVHLSEDR